MPSIPMAPIAQDALMSNATANTPNTQSTTGSATLSKYFSRSQLALALAVQKAKPDGISTKDYCLQLRNNIKSDHGVTNDKSRYVDTCDFWKDQYTRVYQEKKVLEDKLHYLEGKQQSRDGPDTPAIGDTMNTAVSGNQPLPPQDVGGFLNIQQATSTTAEGVMLRLSRYILQIGQRRSKLDKIVKEYNSPDHLDNIAGSAHELLGLLDTALDDCTVPLWFLKCNESTETVAQLQQVMRQIVSSFHHCFNALNELCRTILGRAKRLDLVFSLVMFFSKAMGHLRATCALQADSEIADRRVTRRTRAQLDVEYAVNKYLSEALISMTQIDWKVGKPGHSDILEGILFSILDHAGRLVSNAVFNEHVATSNRVGNISSGCPHILHEAKSLEARYIVIILHAALGGSSTRKELIARMLSDQHTNVDERNSHSTGRTPGDHAHSLLTSARRRIQQTLIKVALGGDAPDGLKLPPPLDEDLEIPQEVDSGIEKYGSEWLLASVWSVLGWELAI